MKSVPWTHSILCIRHVSSRWQRMYRQLMTSGIPGLILGLRPATERRCCFVTTSFIGWAQTENQPWYSLGKGNDIDIKYDRRAIAKAPAASPVNSMWQRWLASLGGGRQGSNYMMLITSVSTVSINTTQGSFFVRAQPMRDDVMI